MEKVIKEFKINNSNNEDLTYKLGYELGNNKVYPRIEIYKDGVLLSGDSWYDGAFGGLFVFFAFYSSSNADGTVGTIKELFTELRKYYYIPEYIETEFESLFLLYKLNDFKELRED